MWAAWLGGIDDEQSYIQQDITIVRKPASLTYWHWIESADACNVDVAQILVDSSQVFSYKLCTINATGGWVEQSVDLSAFIGQTVTLRIQVNTDEAYTSSLFIDDVSLDEGGAELFLPLVVR